eukprot:7961052-Lingulodinium_polyedra.AAC.1
MGPRPGASLRAPPGKRRRGAGPAESLLRMATRLPPGRGWRHGGPGECRGRHLGRAPGAQRRRP